MTEKEKKARIERFEYGKDHWPRGGTTGPVRIVTPFAAIAVRRGDKHADVRGVEALRAGEVVELRIHPEPNANQSLEQVASWYAKELFTLAPDEKLTPFKDSPTRAPDPDAEESDAARIARLEARLAEYEKGALAAKRHGKQAGAGQPAPQGEPAGAG